MQRIIWTLQLFQLYICHSNALYAKLSTATETLQPSQTLKRPGRLERRAVPSEMITCGYKNGGPTAMTTVESGSALCRFSTQNGLWGICKSTGDSKCTLAGRCRDQHDCSDGCGKTENPKFRMTSCKKVEYCNFAYLIMDEGHKYTYVACGAVVARYLAHHPKSPGIDKSPFTNDIDNTTSSGSATEATAEVSDGDRSESRSDMGAIFGGATGGLAVVCGTAVAVVYLLRESRAQKPEATPEKGQGMIEVSGQTETDNGPKELVGLKASDVPANLQPDKLHGTLAPRRPDPVKSPYDDE
ncbi:hypothetical protein FPRO03_06368 [Fusarium proliferatum]|nr:hypothetical protein FPRO03_06368 [Fusarium proliferatum]